MSLRKISKILGISLTYLSLLLNGKRPWRGNLKERYEELVNTNGGQSEIEEKINLDFVSEKKLGGAEGTRTPDFLRAREALSQLSYSPMCLSRISIGTPINRRQESARTARPPRLSFPDIEGHRPVP